MYIKNAENFHIKDCVFYGCGTEGLYLINVKNFMFENSVIKECTYGIMTIESSEELLFKDSKFINNREFYGIDLFEASKIEFDNCIIDGNFTGGMWTDQSCLFSVRDSSDITISGGKISNNLYHYFSLPEDSIDTFGIEMENNLAP